MGNPGIVVVGSLNPEKEIQDRVRVLGVDGICQALRDTDYKDPPKILGTIYTDVSEDFQRGLYPIARCVKASAHDLGIVQMQTERKEEGGAVYLMRTYFVRRLTARECWRLMDFSDSDYEKAEAVNSQSQLYREAGNSIVKNVLVAVFGQMLPGKENIYKDGCGGKSQLLKTVVILAKTIIQTIRAYGAANRPMWAGKVET